jgi:RNA polymerase sigma-70 factor (sigma-E family)
VRADETRSFEVFMAGAADRLLLTAVLLAGGDWAAGEDLLQGAFERTLRHWPRIATGQPEADVRRALVNAATSRWRRLKARVTEVPLLVDGFWTVDPADPAVDHADLLTVREGLIRALRALPSRQRAVVVLRYVEDLPEGDVAAALGCSIGTVRSQAHRGLGRLRASGHLAGLGPPATRRPSPPGTAVDVLTNERPLPVAGAARGETL